VRKLLSELDTLNIKVYGKIPSGTRSGFCRLLCALVEFPVRFMLSRCGRVCCVHHCQRAAAICSMLLAQTAAALSAALLVCVCCFSQAGFSSPAFLSSHRWQTRRPRPTSPWTGRRPLRSRWHGTLTPRIAASDVFSRALALSWTSCAAFAERLLGLSLLMHVMPPSNGVAYFEVPTAS
jgi:hypothetical protein